MKSQLNTKDIGKCLSGLKPKYKNTFIIENIDQPNKLISIKVDKHFTSGTDTSCEMFGLLVYNILKLMPKNWHNEYMGSQFKEPNRSKVG